LFVTSNCTLSLIAEVDSRVGRRTAFSRVQRRHRMQGTAHPDILEFLAGHQLPVANLRPKPLEELPHQCQRAAHGFHHSRSARRRRKRCRLAGEPVRRALECARGR